jgi:hypothetical protein
MEPTVEMIFETRNGIVAENDFVSVIFHFLIITNLHKALLKVDIVATVMISFDENFLTIELFENFDGFCCFTPKHISEDIYDVTRANNRIPSAD